MEKKAYYYMERANDDSLYSRQAEGRLRAERNVARMTHGPTTLRSGALLSPLLFLSRTDGQTDTHTTHRPHITTLL